MKTNIMKLFGQILVMLASFTLIFLADQGFLSDYRIQLSGVLIVYYFVLSYLRRKNPQQKNNLGGTADIFILNTILLLLILITGRLYSPLFFLLYFLCFGITFIFEPITVFIFTIGTIAVLLPEALKNYAIESFVKLGSLVLITPLAYFFGVEYKKRIKGKDNSQSVQEIEKDVSDILDKDRHLSARGKKKLDDILDETKKLRNL